MIGRRSTQCRAIGELMGQASSAISPSGLRTATAQLRGPRIMTPSRTAWPPIAWDIRLGVGRARGGFSLLRLLEPPLEALDTSTGVDELLLARVERVALGADLDVQLGLGRAGHERVPARAVHGRQNVLGMDVGLHGRARIAAAVSAATFPPETTTTGRLASTLPVRSAAAAAAALVSTASFARP